MKEQHDKGKRREKKFQVGQKVWLEGTHINSNQPTKKLEHKRYGPFKVKECIGIGAYRLELPEHWIIHDVFNQELLTIHHEPEFKSQETPTLLAPDLINEEEEYEVEEVRGHRKQGKGVQYLVHWKGYGDEEDQWIPKHNMSHAQEAIEEYYKRFQEKPIKEGGKNTKKPNPKQQL